MKLISANNTDKIGGRPMILLTGMIGIYTIFHDTIAANETINKIFLFVITIHLFLMIMYRFRNELFN